MKLLLDTHAFLWWIGDSPELSEPARKAISSAESEVFLSVASVWELAIKAFLGRFAPEGGPSALGVFVSAELDRNAFRPLPVHLSHAAAVAGLPYLHRDPFDRLLVAQALVEGLTLVSCDAAVQRYPVPLLW